jgi:hypothetical protein
MIFLAICTGQGIIYENGVCGQKRKGSVGRTARPEEKGAVLVIAAAAVSELIPERGGNADRR